MITLDINALLPEQLDILLTACIVSRKKRGLDIPGGYEVALTVERHDHRETRAIVAQLQKELEALRKV